MVEANDTRRNVFWQFLLWYIQFKDSHYSRLHVLKADLLGLRACRPYPDFLSRPQLAIEVGLTDRLSYHMPILIWFWRFLATSDKVYSIFLEGPETVLFVQRFAKRRGRQDYWYVELVCTRFDEIEQGSRDPFALEAGKGIEGVQDCCMRISGRRKEQRSEG